MVDARRKGHVRRFKRIFRWKGDDDAELAAGIDGVGRAFESDVPLVQVAFVRELDGDALWGLASAVGQFLKRRRALVRRVTRGSDRWHGKPTLEMRLADAILRNVRVLE